MRSSLDVQLVGDNANTPPARFLMVAVNCSVLPTRTEIDEAPIVTEAATKSSSVSGGGGGGGGGWMIVITPVPGSVVAVVSRT